MKTTGCLPFWMAGIFFRGEKFIVKQIVLIICAAFILAGCASLQPSPENFQIKITAVSETVNLYYIWATVWTSKGNKNIKAKVDITYRNEENYPVTCNISFYNTSKMPETVSGIELTGKSRDYPVNDTSVLFLEPKYNEIRITSKMSVNALLELFANDVFSLKANVDGVNYQYDPPMEFYFYRDHFVKALNRP